MRPARLGTKAPAATAPALRPFQQEDVVFIKEHDYNVLVANAPGTGKSPTSLMCVTGDRAKLTPTVVVCPASVVTNWCREAKKWVPGAVIHAITDLGSPMPRKRVDIVVISWALLADRYLDLCALKPKFLIADEAHYVKGGADGSLRGQAFSIVARRAPHMIMLSGTPLVNRSSELANLKSYFNVAGEVPMIRRLLEDVLPEIPPKARSTLSVRLRPKDAADYQRAEEDFADWLDRELKRRMSLGEAQAAAERALAAEALTKTGYLRRLLGLAKVPAAVDWISRAVRVGEPVIVFCEHQEVVTRLQKLLTKQNIRHVTIDGGTGRKQRQHAIDTFQAGFAPVFIGTKAAKEGITLTRARNLLFVERYFTSADEEQAEDRCIAEGQLVQTETGLRPIESVRVGDRVLAHTGAWRRVEDTRNFTVKARGFHRPAKRALMTEIEYTRFTAPLVCTYDHKLLVLRQEAWKQGSDEPEWVEAASVLPQDFLCLPVPSEVEDVDVLAVPTEARHDASTTSQRGIRTVNGRFKPLPDSIPVDEETLFFFGWYLAEGFSSVAAGKGRFVSLSAHERERPILERIAACLSRWNIKSSIYANKVSKGIELRAFSAELAHLMRHIFNSGSGEKTLPLWILRLPHHKLRVLWEAYVLGDGYLRNGKQEWRSVSDDLGPKMALVAARLGYRPTLRRYADNSGKNSPIWTGSASVAGDGGNPAHYAQSDKFVFNPVKSVRTYVDGNARVYDLSVEEDESFVVGHAAVHNCRRFGQKYETTIWFLHAAGTLDDRLSEIIDTKRRLVNEIIGGSTVEETEEDAVRELIAAWHENAVKHHQPDAEPTDLGLGKPLPPLPDPRECYQLTFKKPRWAKPSATVWCAMHGFRITEMAATTAGVRVTSVPLARFVPGTFSTVQVSADITAVLGTRKPTVKKAVSKPRTGSGKTPMGAKKVGKKRPARSTPSVSIRSPLLGRW